MQELTQIRGYGEFKQAFDIQLKQVADGFIKIGYLLKVARDTDVLYESGYQSVAEFAQAEYGLTKDVVSRWIAINDRYSENGYSDKLQDKYALYGVAKLGEMLTIRDEVVAQMSPQLTRTDIQEVKKEIQEEEKVTDIEVLLEPQEEVHTAAVDTESLMSMTLYLFWKERPLLFAKMYQLACHAEVMKDEIIDIVAPSGIITAFERISGVGKVMFTIDAEHDKVSCVNVRSGESQEGNINELLSEFNRVFKPCISVLPEEIWQQVYEENYPIVQQAEERKDNKESKRSQSKLSKPEKIEQPEEQLPGQDSINNHPEYMPDEAKEELPASIVEKSDTNEKELDVQVPQTTDRQVSHKKKILMAIENMKATLDSPYGSTDSKMDDVVEYANEIIYAARKIQRGESYENIY